MSVLELGKKAKSAARKIAHLSSNQKEQVLLALAEHLVESQDEILEANTADLRAGEERGMSAALLDRLALNPKRLQGIAADLRQVAALPDPIGEQIEASVLANGLKVRKVRVPLGVVAVIYEARPNVTVDIFSLAFKTGNAVILRGGSETIRSNEALIRVIRATLAEHDVTQDAVQWIQDPDRDRVMELLQLHEYVDMLIPRGGSTLHQFCRENSRIPVITGGIGICHLYVDRSAELENALQVIHNAKVQRPSVCNALDTVLVHQEAAADFLPRIVQLLSRAGVSFRADERAFKLLEQSRTTAEILPAGPDDFDTEWLSLILGLKVVDDLDEALEHIAHHSTGHSDGILTENLEYAQRFIQEVDSAAVYVNASTRFTDGAQLGLGAEAAVSTQKLHARGPLGLRELTTYKWVIEGQYHIRSS
jgi:glutamate-5-semialdehyde dehydrogenase